MRGIVMDAGSLMESLGKDAQNTDKLHPLLQPYLHDVPNLGPCLRHPHVYQVPFFSWKLANAAFEERQIAARAYLSQGDYQHALWCYEPPYQLYMLEAWARGKRMPLADLRRLLREVWPHVENPEDYGVRRISLIFQKAGFITDIRNATWGELFGPGEARLYHGVEAGAKGKPGMSWTYSLKTARFFAGRFDHQGNVLAATFDHDRILGYFDSRGEEEVVVHPKHARDLEVVEHKVRALRFPEMEPKVLEALA